MKKKRKPDPLLIRQKRDQLRRNGQSSTANAASDASIWQMVCADFDYEFDASAFASGDAPQSSSYWQDAGNVAQSVVDSINANTGLEAVDPGTPSDGGSGGGHSCSSASSCGGSSSCASASCASS